MKKPLQICNFSVDISHIEHLYVAIHNYKVIHIQYFKTNWPRKIDGNYFILAFRLVINNLAKWPFFWPREVVPCRNFILCSVVTFWAMSLVRIDPGRAAIKLIAWFVILIIHAFCPSSGEGTYKSDEMKVEEGTLTTAHLCFRTMYGTMDIWCKWTTSMRWEGEAIYSQTHALSHGYPVALGWPCFLLQHSNGLLLIFVAASPAPIVIQRVKTSTGCWLCSFSPKGVGREDLLISPC